MTKLRNSALVVLTVGLGAVGCGGTIDDLTGINAEAALSSQYPLRMSLSPDRSNAVLLQGASVPVGSVYIFTSDGSGTTKPTGIALVGYWLDDPSLSGSPLRVESSSPYDFEATAPDGSAQAWDTSKVSAGPHTITQGLKTRSGAIQIYKASFSVAATTSAHSVALSWKASSTQGVSYDLYRGLTHGGPYTSFQSGLAAVSATDSTVSANTTYYYVVRARNSAGESGSSNEIVAVVP